MSVQLYDYILYHNYQQFYKFMVSFVFFISGRNRTVEYYFTVHGGHVRATTHLLGYGMPSVQSVLSFFSSILFIIFMGVEYKSGRMRYDFIWMHDCDDDCYVKDILNRQRSNLWAAYTHP